VPTVKLTVDNRGNVGVTERRLDVFFLPMLVQSEALRGRSVVVIDVLRASSTIVTALHNGAAQVIPCGEIQDAEAMRFVLNDSGLLLGGERKGLKIEGFDLGNSPLEYSPNAVRGKTIVLATTNGTPAMNVCREAKAVWIGSFVNASAVLQRLTAQTQITLLCAGTNGEITGEDVLFAGCLIERLRQSDGDLRLNDQASMAQLAWRQTTQAIASGTRLADILADMHGGRNLVRAGLRSDIDYCATLDLIDTVPQLDVDAWSIPVP
jgi:2-phosphosulfolactate phosphatase